MTDQEPVEQEQSQSENVSQETSDNQSNDIQNVAEEQPRKKVNGVQQRINELTREKYELARERDHLKQMLEQNGVLNNVGSPPKETEQIDIDRIIDERINQRETARAQSERVHQLNDGWNKKADDFRDRVEDFDEVILNSKIKLPNQALEAIQEMDRGADVAYYLAKHPEEAIKLNGLTPASIIVRLAKIESNLSKTSVQVSRAPDPISPVKARSSVSADPEKMSASEYYRWRNQQRR